MNANAIRRRSGTLDSLRGLTLVSMMAYHACWDLVYLYGMPWDWYTNLATAGLGFPAPAFASSDYFALLPWLFLFWTGFYLYRLRPEIPALPDIRLPGLSVISRHSLLLYLLHQPVLYAALVLLPTIL